LSALGDLVFALPVLHALHRELPGCRVDWLAEDRCAGLPRSHPLVAETLVFPRREWRGGRGFLSLWRHLRGLARREPYDLILDLQSNLKSALHLWHLRGRKAGFARPLAREGAHRFLDLRAPDPGPVHRSRRDLAVLAAAGIAPGEPVFAGWPLPGAPPLALPPRPFVLLHCGVTSYGRDKEWPEERWAALARGLRAAGRAPYALWTPADRPRIERIAAAADGSLLPAPPTPDLAALMALCDAAELLVGTDSGPTHLAAMRGTPVVALFGPTDPRLYAPPGPRARVVYPGAPGEPPPPRDRSRRSPWMERISVAEALAACAETISARAD
jgi:lipopolysaccharide heptosyltransferase I